MQNSTLFLDILLLSLQHLLPFCRFIISQLLSHKINSLLLKSVKKNAKCLFFFLIFQMEMIKMSLLINVSKSIKMLDNVLVDFHLNLQCLKCI